MSIKNKVQLIGNVGQAPEVKTLDSGVKIAKFSIAINEVYKNAEGKKVENTDWYNLVGFGKIAELAQNYVTKGKRVAIEGKLKNNSYTDKNGVKRYSTEIIVNELLLIGSKE